LFVGRGSAEPQQTLRRGARNLLGPTGAMEEKTTKMFRQACAAAVCRRGQTPPSWQFGPAKKRRKNKSAIGRFHATLDEAAGAQFTGAQAGVSRVGACPPLSKLQKGVSDRYDDPYVILYSKSGQSFRSAHRPSTSTDCPGPPVSGSDDALSQANLEFAEVKRSSWLKAPGRQAFCSAPAMTSPPG